MLASYPEDRDLATIWCDQAFTFFDGVERPNVEVHRTRNVLHGQERIQLWHRSDASTVAGVSSDIPEHWV